MTCPTSGGSRDAWGGARGWNADQFGRRLAAGPQYDASPSRWGVWSGAGGGRVVVGALLGPEGTGPSPLIPLAGSVGGGVFCSEAPGPSWSSHPSVTGSRPGGGG